MCVCACVRVCVSRQTHLFPHHHVEASAGLVGKHQPCVIIISVCVHVERCTEVDRVELIKAYTHTHGQTQANTWRETHIDADRIITKNYNVCDYSAPGLEYSIVALTGILPSQL